MIPLFLVLKHFNPLVSIFTVRISSPEGEPEVILEWDASLGIQPTQAEIDAARVILEAQKAKGALNAPILAQIAALEASCTDRRWREHVMGVNVTFIPDVDAAVAVLRAQLIK